MPGQSEQLALTARTNKSAKGKVKSAQSQVAETQGAEADESSSEEETRHGLLAANDQITDSGRAKGITTRKVITIGGKGRQNKPLIEETETANIEGEEFVEDKLVNVVVCQCGKKLTSADVMAVDVNGDWLCAECASVRCAHCHKSTGVESRVALFGETYCKKCTAGLAVFVLIFCIVIAAAVWLTLCV